MGNVTSEEFMSNVSSGISMSIGINQVTQTLQKLPICNVDMVYRALLWIDSHANNKSILKDLAFQIIEFSSTQDPLKYLELSKKLSNFTVNDSREEITFKDIFIQACIEKFDAINKSNQTTAEKSNHAVFFGNLFNLDLISAVLISHWTVLLKNQSELQLMLLRIIKDKVLSECEKPMPQRNIDKLRMFLIEKEIIQPEQVGQMCDT